MNIPEFVHLVPRDLREACAMLAEFPGQSKALAGGTDILVKMKHRRALPRYLVNLKKIRGLDYIRHEPGKGLAIGPLTTIEALKNSIVVRKNYPVLHDAVSCMGTLEIRNCGTLAGNVCNASPAAETVPALQLLGARARIVDNDRESTVPLESFFTGPGRTLLEPAQLVSEIRIPEPPQGAFGAYDKFSLRRMDLAIVGAAVLLELSGGVCRQARLVLSAVGPTTLRLPLTESLLAGQALDAARIEEAARSAAGEIKPQSDIQGTAEQKRAMAAELTARVLRQALQRARKAGS